MSLAQLQPKKDGLHIFVSFPGIKMKTPFIAEQRKKGRKGVTLCIQLDEQHELSDFYFVREGFIPLVNENNQTVVKLPQSREGNTPTEYKLTNTLSIIQKETDAGYEYVLVHKTKQESGRRKVKRNKPVQMKITEHVLFSVQRTKKKERGPGSMKQRICNTMRHSIREMKKVTPIFNKKDQLVEDIMRISKMRSFERDACCTPAVLRFLGPGDQVLPLPRAEPSI
ncbi:hypothetical protein [Bacillus sp. 165]|uniref:hypothetical protein n=1 Tax=Bacillus sp. 165 TaxID=1529117 RepID=UPI001ADACC65|nr:hypothetical protein [Bacillus sp. 165]MBO9129243.1 hypothetical protein [Bacillus sp. 165]